MNDILTGEFQSFTPKPFQDQHLNKIENIKKIKNFAIGINTPNIMSPSSVTQLPSTHSVIKQIAGGVLSLQTAPLPTLLEPDQILLKNHAVALNPVDWKIPSRFPCPGATDGSDFAGTIVSIGSGVSRTDLHIGDAVCGAVHANNPVCLQSGTFGEYVVAYADLVLKVPDVMKWEDAAAIGGCVHGSLGLAFWDSLGLPGHPDEPAGMPVYVLVYGGSTASGTMAIQLVKAYVLL